jgi:hypothetical protein
MQETFFVPLYLGAFALNLYLLSCELKLLPAYHVINVSRALSTQVHFSYFWQRKR